MRVFYVIYFFLLKIMDGIVITEMRTAAASAVATKVTFFLIKY